MKSLFGFLKKRILGDSDKAMRDSIVKMVLPTFFELLLSTLFGVVDTFMVAQAGLGPEALSGVGLTNQPFALLTTVFQAVNVGTTTLVAWAIGAGNHKRPSQVLKQTVIFNFAVGMLMSVLGYVFAEPLMALLTSGAQNNAATPEEIASHALMLSYSVQYFQIISLSVVAQAVTLGVSAALRGSGRAKVVMAYNIFSNACNVVMNALLIYGLFGLPKLDVAGAALATTLARFIGAGVALYTVVFRSKDLPVKLVIRESWKPNIRLMRDIFSIGIPSALEQFVLQGGITVFSAMVNSLGALTYAAHTTVQQINSITLAVGQSFSVSTTTLVGQALGADDPDRAENITKLTRRLARMATFVVAVVFVAAGYYIALFYNGGDANAAQIAALAWPIFVIAAVNQYSQSVQMSTAGALRGAGDTMYPFYSSLCGIIISRIGLAYLFINVFHWGLIGAWIAFLFDQLTRSFVIRWRFSTGKWKQMKAIKEERSRKRMEKYNRGA